MATAAKWPQRLAIVGTGLLGASVGLAARAAGVPEVVGVDADRQELRDAFRREAITERGRSVEEAADGADLVVAATPVRSLAQVLARSHAANPNAVLSDVGSTKSHLLAELASLSTNLGRVVPGHPMAGSEQRGAQAARADLFHGAAWVLTPAAHVDHTALRRMTRFVRGLGGRPLILDPDLHDQVVAFASHLPQLAATALMGAVAQVQAPAALRSLVASGFKDTTRIAASDPDLWVDICATNAPSIVAALDALGDRLTVLRKLVASGDRDGLRGVLGEAQTARLHIPTKPGSSPRGLRELVVHIADRPGSLASVFRILGAAGVNVEDLSIDHELQGGSGNLRVWVAGREALGVALTALNGAGWTAHEAEGA
ncbi:MAG TPA: prephenate dehydrogenase/arogenate dehydrogenase family protein [Actinomycetes bacterium]